MVSVTDDRVVRIINSNADEDHAGAKGAGFGLQLIGTKGIIDLRFARRQSEGRPAAG